MGVDQWVMAGRDGGDREAAASRDSADGVVGDAS
jgi:hypothetical protein